MQKQVKTKNVSRGCDKGDWDLICCVTVLLERYSDGKTNSGDCSGDLVFRVKQCFRPSLVP